MWRLLFKGKKKEDAMKDNLIIWDWNGTLLNDVDWGIEVMNTMLKKRSLPLLNSRADYHRVFTFPVIEYYRNVGLDFEKDSFEELAEEYIILYYGKSKDKCILQKNAEYVLNVLQDKGMTQVILSASQQEHLVRQVTDYGVENYFEALLGISDIYANSKIEAGLQYLKRKRFERIVLVGDSLHDCETARALGAECLLIANGHQSRDTLLTSGECVLEDIMDIVSL